MHFGSYGVGLLSGGEGEESGEGEDSEDFGMHLERVLRMILKKECDAYQRAGKDRDSGSRMWKGEIYMLRYWFLIIKKGLSLLLSSSP